MPRRHFICKAIEHRANLGTYHDRLPSSSQSLDGFSGVPHLTAREQVGADRGGTPGVPDFTVYIHVAILDMLGDPGRHLS